MFSIKRYLKLLWFITCLLAFSTTFAQYDYYYYGNGQKIPLLLSPNKVNIKFTPGMTPGDIYNFILSDDALNPNLGPYPFMDGYFILYVLPGNDIKTLIQRLRNRQEVEMANPGYLTTDSMALMVTDRFVVQFYEWVPRSTIDSLNALHGAIIIDSLSPEVPNLFLLKLTGDIDKDVLVTANQYYEEPTTDYSHPDFIAIICMEFCDYIPGDLDGDSSITVSDIVYLINYLFKFGPPPFPFSEIADANCNGRISLTDIVYLINYLVREGPKPEKCFLYSKFIRRSGLSF